MLSSLRTKYNHSATVTLLSAAAAGCCIGLFAATPSWAGTYSVLAAFPISTTTTLGRKPGTALYVDANENIYGYTSSGGTNNSGVFFELPAGSNTPVPLYSNPGFTSITGLTVGADGGVYAGTVGSNSTSYVLSINPSPLATAATVLYSASTTTFNAGGSNGASLQPAVDSAGNVYGASAVGGTFGHGYVWKLNKGASSPTIIYSFGANALDITSTSGGRYITLDSAGNIYVTTSLGGTNNTGMVSKIAAGTQTETVLYSFGASTGTDGQQPFTGVSIDSKGNIFGTTAAGGAHAVGTLWEIAAGSTTEQTIYDFGATNAPSFQPVQSERLTIDGADNIFGVASVGNGTASNGAVFEIPAGTSNFQMLHTFTGNTDGANPVSALTLDSFGNLFGTTFGGGCATNNCGTIFELSGYATPLTLQSAGTSVPEPASLALFGEGLTLLSLARRRSRHREIAQ